MAAMVIFRGEIYIRTPSSPKAGWFFYSLSSIVDLEELAPPLHSSHDSCIFLWEKRKEIDLDLSFHQSISLMAATLFFKCACWGFKRRVMQQEKFSPHGLLGVIIKLSGKPEVGSLSSLFKQPTILNK
jgi:hypothetical protein